MSEKDDSGSGVSTSTLIHVGVEFLCAAGLVYWVHTKTGKIDEMKVQMDAVVDRCNKYEEIINQQQQLIIKHEQALAQLYSTISGKKMMPPNPNIPRQPVQRPQPTPNQKPPQKGKQQKIKKPVEKTFNDAEDEAEDTMVDPETEELLADELAELKGNSQMTDFDDDNNECEDGQCPVNFDEPQPVRNKKKLKS